MTTRIWVGGGNNQATNPNDWSPTGVPQPGDTLYMTGGTMNVSGYNLADAGMLIASGTDIINLSNNASFGAYLNGPTTVNISGTDTALLDPSSDASTVVNLAAHSVWIGSFGVASGSSISIKRRTFQNDLV